MDFFAVLRLIPKCKYINDFKWDTLNGALYIVYICGDKIVDCKSWNASIIINVNKYMYMECDEFYGERKRVSEYEKIILSAHVKASWNWRDERVMCLSTSSPFCVASKCNSSKTSGKATKNNRKNAINLIMWHRCQSVNAHHLKVIVFERCRSS